MPQSERSHTLKELLRWLDARTKSKKGATIQEIINHTTVEITELGATDRAVRGYIRTLVRTGMIEMKVFRYYTTDKCKNWLKKVSL